MLPSAKQEMSSSLKEANEGTHIFQTKCHQKVGSKLEVKIVDKTYQSNGFFFQMEQDTLLDQVCFLFQNRNSLFLTQKS